LKINIKEARMDFGWKQKAERLRMVILSAGHRLAKELPPGISKTLAIFGRVAKSGDGTGLQEEMDVIHRDYANEAKPIWEPIEIYGWKIEATLYLTRVERDGSIKDLNGQLWWLVHAARRNEKEPSDKDVAFLDKVLAHLGADPKRDMIIGPSSSSAGEPALSFGWWTWFNRSSLYEIQVNKHKKKDKDKFRVVPLGTRETDGYQSIDAIDKKDL
jgi:hypothetical protein